MNITPRLLLASVLVSATIGGTLSALVTAATTSQANPQTVAAAVQRVSDTSAERALRLIAIDLVSVKEDDEKTAYNTSTTDQNTFDICRNVQKLVEHDLAGPEGC